MYFDDAKYVSSHVPEIIYIMLQIRAEQIKLLGLLYYAFGERRWDHISGYIQVSSADELIYYWKTTYYFLVFNSIIYMFLI